MVSAGDDAIDNLIQDVVSASKIPPKARSTNVKLTVTQLSSAAYDRGLLPDALAQLVDLIASPCQLDQASLAALVRNLYPRTKVARHVVLHIVGALGHGVLKPPLGLQAALLRWLVMVFDVLEERVVLTRVYPVLFNLLDTAAIRPQLAHLLALTTRRRHVRPFRIQALLSLSMQTAHDPCIVGLLRVFKDYYPEIVVGEAIRGKASAFKHPDVQWRARLHELQEAHLRLTDARSSGPLHGFRVNKTAKGSLRNSLVPTVQTSQATEDSVTLEEIDNVTHFVDNLERLELPNQLVAVLSDPLLQKLLVLRPSAVAHQRVAYWLDTMLENATEGDAGQETLWEVLEVVSDYIAQTKTLPPSLLNFFAQFLPVWNGSGHRHLIMDILAYAPLHDFQELYQQILQPLEAAIADESPETQLALLNLYTNLLHQWTTTLRSSDSVAPGASQNVTLLVRHTGCIALTAIQTAPGAATESAILSFYEQTARLVGDDVLRLCIRVELPPSTLVYMLFFSSSLATVSRLCRILVSYKRSIETAMSIKPRRDSSVRVNSISYDGDYIDRYNSFLMDICNCLWRSRAFSHSDANARGCLVPRATVSALEAYVATVDQSASLATLFCLSHAPLLCLQSIQAVRAMEEAAMDADPAALRSRHAGPVTRASLARLASAGGIHLSWQDYRILVLRALSDKGLSGVEQLLRSTMTVLRDPKAAGSPGTLRTGESKTTGSRGRSSHMRAPR